MFKHLFKEFLPLNEAYYNDPVAIYAAMIGGVLIAVTFIVIGALCVIFSKANPYNTPSRTIMTKLFGFFLITCGIARVIDVLCLWHNYAIINGYVKILTGLLALAAIAMIPKILKQSLEDKRMQEIKKGLKETNQSLDTIKELTDKLNNDTQ